MRCSVGAFGWDAAVIGHRSMIPLRLDTPNSKTPLRRDMVFERIVAGIRA
jgi:hypothetical protein